MTLVIAATPQAFEAYRTTVGLTFEQCKFVREPYELRGVDRRLTVIAFGETWKSRYATAAVETARKLGHPVNFVRDVA